MKSSAKLVLLFVAVGLLLALPSAPRGSPLAFPGVDASELAKSNVRLKTPGSVAPHVSKEEAVNAALLPGATLRDATLAIVESS